MLTVELIADLREILSDLGGSDKTKIETMLVALNEFKAIEIQIIELRKLIKKLIDKKHLDKYIELNGSIYCLDTLEEFELILASENELRDIANIEKQINQSHLEIKEMIDKSDHQLNSLYDKRGELLEKLFSDAKNKAVKNDEVLILDDNIIFLED
jgi:hypothetical protein